MSETAYLIVSDLHLRDSNLRGRHDYNKEVSSVVSKIINLGMSYKEKGFDNVSLIFLGDIYDRSYKNLTEGIFANNIFVGLRNIFDNIYSVVGNHELSYYTDNPFWTLMQSIDSPKIEKIKNRTWQPKGFIQLIDVVDELQDGNVVFHFNHHSTGVSTPIDGKVNIGLFHQDIISKDITAEMKRLFDLDIFEVKPRYFDNSSVLYGYDYAFFGHMHKIYGSWTYLCPITDFKTELFYLGSLGRTNHTEVQNNFLERDIPAVIIENGLFSRIEHNKFNLLSREDSVKEEVVSKNKEDYERKKEIKYVVSNIPDLDEPMDNIRAFAIQNPVLHRLFTDYQENGYSSIETNIANRIMEVLR